MKDKVLLFIPMYNCEKQITRVLGQLDQEMMNYISSVLIVNNRSIDHSEEAVERYLKQHEELPVVLVRNDKNYGLGGSHKVAFQYAIDHKMDYIIVLHGDDQADIHDVLPVLKGGEYRKHDCCMGARFLKESKLIGYSKFRTFGNRVYNLLFSIVLLRKTPELGSSLKIYKADMLMSRFYLKFCDDLAFDYCMTLASGYYKQDYYYFPITFREEDQVSNVKLFNQAVRVLKMLVSYRLMPKRFVTSELRAITQNGYAFKVVYSR